MDPSKGGSLKNRNVLPFFVQCHRRPKLSCPPPDARKQMKGSKTPKVLVLKCMSKMGAPKCFAC
eukprot:2359930-Amphidinium_carterae.1